MFGHWLAYFYTSFPTPSSTPEEKEKERKEKKTVEEERCLRNRSNPFP